MNNVILVGRVYALPTDTNTLTIEVKRDFKDLNGNDKDYINVNLFGKILENAKEVLIVGDTVAIKGRLERPYISDNLNIVAINLSFMKRGCD